MNYMLITISRFFIEYCIIDFSTHEGIKWRHWCDEATEGLTKYNIQKYLNLQYLPAWARWRNRRLGQKESSQGQKRWLSEWRRKFIFAVWIMLNKLLTKEWTIQLSLINHQPQQNYNNLISFTLWITILHFL